jgi:hypothetical protein
VASLFRNVAFLCGFCALCQSAIADGISTYDVTLDSAPLVGHPAGPFYVYLEFIDGSGVGDANNTVTVSDVNFGGGSALGNPLLFGGATGSLETGVSITDSSFTNIFGEQFAPGLELSFSLGLTSNDDSGGIPDGFTFFLLDSSGVPLPTLAPSGDYFLTAGLGSSGPTFNVYASDASRALSVGGPVSIPAPSIDPVSSMPEPESNYLLSAGLIMIGLSKLIVRGLWAKSGRK